MVDANSPCPCRKNQPTDKQLNYGQCCQPLHQGQAASTCEQLMRSRFSAFILGLGDYLTKSWHSSTRPTDLQVKRDDQWLKLDIIKSGKTQVHFHAYFQEDGQFHRLNEVSDFVFEAGHCYYLTGETQIETVQPNRNDLCLCGSGKKYKKCCAD